MKNKNIRLISGLPLIAYTLEIAENSGLFSHIAVSSDSVEILEVSRAFGADIQVSRPANLASHAAPKLPAIRHCVLDAERQADQKFDRIFDLDATSPLRGIEDLVAVDNFCNHPTVTNVITASPAHRSPYFNLIEISLDVAPTLSKTPPKEVVRRQDAPKCYDMNASIYAWNKDHLFEMTKLFCKGTRVHIMPEERSHDIDSEHDFDIVEFLLNKRTSK